MNNNLWMRHRLECSEAFSRSNNLVRDELAARNVVTCVRNPSRIVDVGGGSGTQAIKLAQLGHEVVIVDADANMLTRAERNVAAQPREIRERLSLVQCSGENAYSVLSQRFDVVCCHSVLMYIEDKKSILNGLIALCSPGAVLSVLSVNPESVALRLGLQQRWRDALALLHNDAAVLPDYLPSHKWSREQVEGYLREGGAEPIAWFGVGLFTDHLRETSYLKVIQDVVALEAAAGSRDPYRRLARCFQSLLRFPCRSEPRSRD